MQQYGVRDVEKLLGLPRSTIRALITAGFVAPVRGPRNAWLFSFQDLIVLRTAQSLAAANLPHRRITRSLKELRRHLPETMPLSGLRIGAVADHVVVSEGSRRWRADSGQYLLAFEGDPQAGSLSVIERAAEDVVAETLQPQSLPGGRGKSAAAIPRAAATRAPTRAKLEAPGSGDWFERAVALEHDVDAAAAAYERAIDADPVHMDARINLGRLLHEAGRLKKAERAYRDAIRTCGDDAVVWFNLGVLLEDMLRRREAVAAYEAALRADPALADAHFNIALLYEQFARPKEALRHMAQYRRLLGGKR